MIINYFLSKDKHYSVEALYNEIKKNRIKVSYSTIYRTLKKLEQSGLANELDLGDGVIRYEPVHNGVRHDHFICMKCKRIIEFYDEKIEKIQKKVANKYRFLIKSHRLDIFGLCEKCREKDEKIFD